MDGHVIDNLGANMVDAITFSENHFFSSSNDFLIIKIKPSFSINEGAFSIYSKMKLIETLIDDISNIYNIS